MNRPNGFTILEVVAAVLVAAILTSMVIQGAGEVQRRLAVRQARNVFSAVHARARAQAVEFGQRTRFRIDAVGDSIWVVRNDSILEIVRLGDELGVDIQGPGNSYTVCMSPRGFADDRCNSFASPVTLSFVMGSDTAFVRMLPLGQLVY